jgi:hypothetical protein
MTKDAIYRINWSSERDVYEYLENHRGMSSVSRTDHLQLQLWLSTIASFAFSGKAGAYTARKECTPQGNCQQLIIATSTVKSHLNTIYGKLQVQSRTQAVARANALHLL